VIVVRFFQQSKVLFRKNLKQKKRSAAATKRKRLEKAEADAVTKHFDAKKAARESESAARVGFFTWVFRWVRSFC
jgi:hypothetical protein